MDTLGSNRKISDPENQTVNFPEATCHVNLFEEQKHSRVASCLVNENASSTTRTASGPLITFVVSATCGAFLVYLGPIAKVRLQGHNLSTLSWIDMLGLKNGGIDWTSRNRAIRSGFKTKRLHSFPGWTRQN